MKIYATPTCICPPEPEMVDLMAIAVSGFVEINGISINGTPIGDLSNPGFPIPGDGDTFRTGITLAGLLEISITANGPEQGTQCIIVTDSDGVVQCQQFSPPGGDYIFSNITGYSGSPITIEVTGDSCTC